MALSFKWQETLISLWKLYRAIWRWYYDVYDLRVRGRSNMRALSPVDSPAGDRATVLTPLSVVYSPVAPPSGPWAPFSSSKLVDFSLTIAEGRKIPECLRVVTFDLLNRRRTRIHIPNVDPQGSGPVVANIVSEVMHPITCMINCLRDDQKDAKVFYEITPHPDAEVPSIVQAQVLIGEYSEALASDYAESSSRMPLILFYPPNHLEQLCAVQPQNANEGVKYVVRIPSPLRYQLDEKTPLIITDFARVFMAEKIDTFEKTIEGEICACQPRTSLRYVLASSIMAALPSGYFDLHLEIFTAPSGALNNPDLPQPSDHEVFATRHRHADFDRYVLAYTPSAIPQFLRWKHLMQARESTRMEGDVLTAELWAFSRIRGPFQPRYPLEQLPENTVAHLVASKRQIFPEFVELLKGSSHTLVALEDELTHSGGTGYARTFACRMLQVDGKGITVQAPSKLCVKIYDDSGGKVMPFREGNSGPAWLQEFYTAEEMLQNEENVYTRLQHAWGSTIPFYYGIHRFACKDGRYRYGLLMELVPKSAKPLREHSRSAQISFIQSARHAVRVLQYADITQYDWSDNMEQIIVTASPDLHRHNEEKLGCTLVDFALARQGDVFFDVEREDDYASMASSIIIDVNGGEDGVEAQLVRDYYGPREEWDFLRTDLPS